PDLAKPLKITSNWSVQLLGSCFELICKQSRSSIVTAASLKNSVLERTGYNNLLIALILIYKSKYI
ncbi:hypothetical protein J1N10_20525, partial [Carboxylicivirga sp. A043]|uniref:hypothetical protein n=1 Tax=Carboxylicivirga litoralis TaxID=2816963 RepID=UPI0021CB31F3